MVTGGENSTSAARQARSVTVESPASILDGCSR